MNVKHTSAFASHYDQQAKHYDEFNEALSAKINKLIVKILHEHKVKSVLDLTCGTGSQVLWLAKCNFEVVGVDINSKMLALAKRKAKQQNLSLRFEPGDMRTSKVGQFDAGLTIFNSIGHLTKEDFDLAIKNIHTNLKPGGLYIFDIINLEYLLHENNITKLTIDWQKKTGDTTVRKIQYSTIAKNGVLASYDIYYEQIGDDQPKITRATQTLQIYSSDQLKMLLRHNGFEVIKQFDVDGVTLRPQKSERIVTVARKVTVTPNPL